MEGVLGSKETDTAYCIVIIVEYNYMSNVCNYHIGTCVCKHVCFVYV